MRALVALLAFAGVTALNFLWWSLPNRPVEIAGWTTAPLQSVSFAPYRPGQSPLTRTFPTAEQIDDDLHRLQGKVRAVRTYSTGENLEAVPQRAGKYGLKVWHGAWLNDNEKENLEQVNLLIDHANKYKDTIERVIVGNEVLLRKDLTANELRRYIRQVKQRVTQPVTYADVWEFWLRNPSLADEVDFITIHILPYWEDEPIGLDRREPDGTPSIEKHIVDIYKKVQARFPDKKIVIGETGWPSDGRMRSERREENDIAAAAQDRQQLLHQKIGRAYVDGEETVKIRDRYFLHRGRFRNSRIGHDDVESIPDQVANQHGERVRPVGSGEIRRDGVGMPAGRADLIDHGFGFIRVAAVVDDDASARGGKRQGGCAAHAARGASDEGGFVGERAHSGSPVYGAKPSGIVRRHEYGRPLP